MRRADPDLADPTLTVRRLSATSAGDWLADDGAADVVVVYKHSPICAESLLAAQEVRYFAQDFPEIAVYQVDVVAQRDLARDLARSMGVPHESPQAIVLRNGRVTWAGSHGRVAYDELKRRTGTAGG